MHRSRLALRVIRGMSAIWSLTEQSGHSPALTLNLSVANDPKRTFGVNLTKEETKQLLTISSRAARFKGLIVLDMRS